MTSSCCSNNDVEPPPSVLERLVAPLNDERIGSVAALLLEPGDQTIESFGLAVDATLAGYPRLRGEPAAAAQTHDPILIGPSGAAGAYRRVAWEQVGGLDEGVFAYAEDVDLAAPSARGRLGDCGSAGRCCPTPRIGEARLRARRGSGTRAASPARTSCGVTGFCADALRYVLLRRRAWWSWATPSSIRGRVALPAHTIDTRITFRKSLTLRRGVYSAKTDS